MSDMPVTIPGVETVHPREVWEPSNFNMATDFNRTPSSLRLDRVDRAAIHYTAALDIADGDPGEETFGVLRLLSAITVDYYTNKTGGGYTRLSDDRYFPGFPFGYSWAVDWLGGVWEGRGWDYQPAATGGHNGHTIAILMLTDRHDPGSELMWASCRAIQREAVRRGANLPNRPMAHGWFNEQYGYGTPTACCGAALKQQILEGYGDLDRDEGNTMTKPVAPLPAGPVRAYDSRPNFQGDVDPALAEVNKQVPRTPLAPGETRKIVVGLCVSAEVTVHFQGAQGWVKVSGHPTPPATALTQADADGGVSATGTFATPEGAIYVTSLKGGDFQVDVNARG